MFKQMMTLLRGRSADAAEQMLDANAMSLLRGQLREAAAGVEKTRKALAVVMAYADREEASLARYRSKIQGLEGRAQAALEKGEEALALETASTIADLEAEADATERAAQTYKTEIAQLREVLRDSEAQLKTLQRGQRLAAANDKALKLRGAMPQPGQSDMSDAAATLRRLQERQDHAAATARALQTLTPETHAKTLEARLAAAGIPQITVVHGSSTAGGAYLPGLSDYVVMVKKQSKVFLAGPPLLKAATGDNAGALASADG